LNFRLTIKDKLNNLIQFKLLLPICKNWKNKFYLTELKIMNMY